MLTVTTQVSLLQSNLQRLRSYMHEKKGDQTQPPHDLIFHLTRKPHGNAVTSHGQDTILLKHGIEQPYTNYSMTQ
jgi:hypothetical protein